MKKILLSLFIFLCMFAFLTGCKKEDSDKIKIVCTIFPEYDWVKEVTNYDSDKYDVKLLLNSGIDMHSYQASIDDIATIQTSDLFIYVGGESDEWVEDVLEGAKNAPMTLNLMDILKDKIKEEEIKEGMEHEGEEEHDHEEKEYDEHVWLSILNSKIIVEKIAATLKELNKEDAAKIEDAKANYIAKLDALHQSYVSALSTASNKTLIFGDRFPFRYLVDDYKLDYYAAFVGCSAESEASFETIIFLANKVDELKAKVILKIDNASDKIAKSIKNNTSTKDQIILSLNSMQVTTTKDNLSYIKIMEDNLEILKQATR